MMGKFGRERGECQSDPRSMNIFHGHMTTTLAVFFTYNINTMILYCNFPPICYKNLFSNRLKKTFPMILVLYHDTM